MRHPGPLTVFVGIALAFLILSGMGDAQQNGATIHTVFLTALEVKGSTTTDALPPPTVNPADLSKGYGFKGPGQADRSAPQKWEVSSYLFVPAWATVRRGDTVALTVFVVNGDEHEVSLMAPDGERVVATAKWNRGRQYHAEFVAAKSGTYQLVCSTHAPSMIASFGVLPK